MELMPAWDELIKQGPLFCVLALVIWELRKLLYMFLETQKTRDERHEQLTKDFHQLAIQTNETINRNTESIENLARKLGN